MKNAKKLLSVLLALLTAALPLQVRAKGESQVLGASAAQEQDRALAQNAPLAQNSSLAQEHAQWNRYYQEHYRSFWHDGVNVAGIRHNTAPNDELSEAGIMGSYESGDFRTISQSSEEWTVKAGASSLKHLERYSMKGSFSFSDTEAQGMSGSMFLDKGFFPVDVFEFTPGRKTFQTYTINGGIAVDMGDRWNGWTIGMGLDFKARNVAKRKDLRYSSYRMDMNVTPSVTYQNAVFKTGLAMVYKRNTETINAEQTGTAQAAPFAFFDEGLALGNWQVWTGNGSRLKENGVNGLPVVMNTLGASIQAATTDGQLYAHATYLARKGSVGERQTIWYRFAGNQVDARISARLNNSTLRATFGWADLNNRETVQDKVVEGGISMVREHGSNNILKSSEIKAGLDYGYMENGNSIQAGVLCSDYRRMATPMYPYVYGRDLKIVDIYSKGFHTFHKVLVGAALGWSKGFADDHEYSVVSGMATTSVPYRSEQVWADACKAETAQRLNAGLNIDWNFHGNLHALVSGMCTYAYSYKESRYDVCIGLNYTY